MVDSPLAIASDHAGFALKAELVGWLTDEGHRVIDLGPDSEDRVDYPDFGARLARAVASGEVGRGIAICGTGIGIAIAVNRELACRCALVSDGLAARLAREHNDANVLALGARLIGVETARECVRQFLHTPFGGGRHSARVAKLGHSPAPSQVSSPA